MRIAVLGTGMVGRTLAGALVERGHDVTMGARDAGNERARAWADEAGDRAAAGSFADAAAAGEVVLNCTAGTASLAALEAAGADNLADKLLLDVANPIETVGGGQLSLSVCNTDSLAERIQAAYPRSRVVKALNTVNCDVMVDPGSVPGDHAIFVCGNDEAAKSTARGLVGELGWPPERIVDLGDITAARATEMYLPLWVRMMGRLGTPRFNIAINVAPDEAASA